MITARMTIGTRIREEHGDAVWTIAGIDANRQLVLLECHDVNTASAGIVPPVAPVVPVETRNDVEPLSVLTGAQAHAQGREGRLEQALRSQRPTVPELRRLAQMVAEDDQVITCVRCGRTWTDVDLCDPEAGTGRIFCDECWPHRAEEDA